MELTRQEKLFLFELWNRYTCDVWDITDWFSDNYKNFYEETLKDVCDTYEIDRNIVDSDTDEWTEFCMEGDSSDFWTDLKNELCERANVDLYEGDYYD